MKTGRIFIELIPLPTQASVKLLYVYPGIVLQVRPLLPAVNSCVIYQTRLIYAKIPTCKSTLYTSCSKFAEDSADHVVGLDSSVNYLAHLA